nr:ATP-dependent 6-phosphofructokinase 4, chloroplastic-like [Tanacetum cinerariifolium]
SPFYLEGEGGLFEFVQQRLRDNGHVVIELAEGAVCLIRQRFVSSGLSPSSGLLVAIWKISNVPVPIPDHLCLIGLISTYGNNVFDCTVEEKRMWLTYLIQLMRDHSRWERLERYLLKVTKALHLGPERPQVYSDLSPEEKERFVTVVKLNTGLKDSNYDQLYAYLKQHEEYANEKKMMNQATVQNGRVVVHNIQGLLNRGQGNNAKGTCATGYEGAQNRVGNTNPGQARQIKCYNYKILLMKAQDNGVALDEEQLLFITGGQDNVDEDVDEQPVQDLALNMDNIFQADECDVFDSDVDEAPTAQTEFMKNPSSAYLVYDKADSSYDSDILSKVHDHDNYQDAICELHRVYEIHDHVQPNCIVDSNVEHTSDSNMIPYDQNNREVHLDYLKHLKESVATLHEIVEEAWAVRPIDRSLASAFHYTKHSQELLEYVVSTYSKDFNKRDNKHASTPLTRNKQVTFEDQCVTSNNNIHKHLEQLNIHKTNVPVILSTGGNSCTNASGSKPKSNTKKNRISPAKSVNKKKVEKHPRTKKSSLNHMNRVGSSIISTRCSKHMTGDRSWLRNFIKKFIGTVRFGNDNFGAIMGYGDYVIGDTVISRVYFAEGIGHNLVSVG